MPAEIIVSQSFADDRSSEDIKQVTGAYINVVSDEFFGRKAALEALKAQFDCLSVTALGIEEDSLSVPALGALLGYLWRHRNTVSNR